MTDLNLNTIMSTTINEHETVDALAKEFGRQLRLEFTPAEMDEINKRNREYGPDFCATHEFCDANMVMLGLRGGPQAQPAGRARTGR